LRKVYVALLPCAVVIATREARAGCHEDLFCTRDLAGRWGVRASFTRAAREGSVEDAASGSFSHGLVTHGYDGWLRLSSDVVLGGGSASFEGGIGETLDIGPSVALSKETALFTRAGIDARILGNKVFLLSLLELPRGTVGVRYTRGDVLVEGGARAGLVLAGLYKSNGYRHTLDEPEWGGFGELQAKYVFIDASAMRIASTNVGRLVLCAASTPRDLTFIVCADGMLIDTGAGVSTAYGGLLFGFGLVAANAYRDRASSRER
jgi:hypothetical protein